MELRQHCLKCKSTENLLLNSRRKNKTKPDTLRHMCRVCNTERLRKYRQTDEGKEAFRRASRRSIEKNRHKQDAREQINYAINSGKIERPKICPVCEEEKMVQAHHADYSKPLDVTWSCRQCYFDERRKDSIM